MRHGPSLPTRLALLVVTGIVPLLAFVLGIQALEYRQEVVATGARTLTLARTLSLLVERELHERVAALQTLAQSPALLRGDLGRFREQAEAVIAAQFPGSNVLLLRDDGQVLLSTRAAPGAPLPRRPNLGSVQRVVATGRPAVSDVFHGAISQRPVVAIDVPVKTDDGTGGYLLSMNPNLDAFADLLHGQRPAETWVIGIFDRRGVTVARVPHGDRFVGQAASASFLGPLQGGGEGIAETTSLEGTPLLSAFSHGERFGWAVGIGVPKQELTAPILRALIETSAVGVLILVGGLFLALYVARGIARPIGSLRRLATAGEGDALPDPAPTGLPEVDEVARALHAAEQERRSSSEAEKLLRDGIQSIPEGFAIYDDDDRLVMCNDAYQSLFADSAARVRVGARFEDIVRRGVERGHYAAARGREEEWIADRVREHRDASRPIEQRLADGRWVLATKHRLPNGWIASLRVDITALKQAEQKARGSEERFRGVVEAMPSAIVIVNVRGAIEMVNLQAERIFGYPRAEMLGRPVEMLLPERFHARHPTLRDAFFAAPEARMMGVGRDLYAIRKDRGEFPVEVGLSPIETGGDTLMLASIIDITERKQAERSLIDARQRSEEMLAALARSEQQLQRAQRLAHMGSILVELRTGNVEWSDETYRIIGVSRDSFVPSLENLVAVTHPDDRHLLLAARHRAERGSSEPYKYRIVRPDGTIRYVYRESELIRDEIGTVTHLAGTLQDVTERHQTEEQLRQAQKMEAIGNLTGGMAHDFNNLLGIIIGNLGLARDEVAGNPDAGEMIGEALEAAWRGADLTRRLLAFARRQPLRPVRIDVNELVTDIVRLLRRVLGENIEVRLDLGDDIWPVTADPAQLEASIANLATNSRDAMPSGGRLFLATANQRLDAAYAAQHAEAAEGDFVLIEVSDTGSGMPPEILDRIFEPFFTTKEAGKGTGLGLSMVFGFLRQSGGHVSVYSEPGNGTTFRLYLPREAADLGADDIREEPSVEHGGGETVLVVEDNPGVRRIVVRQLRSLGYSVFECDRAAEALELLQNVPADLLFTDIVMPGGLDGVELAKLARERWPDLKILLTSGFPQARLDDNGEALRGVGLLSKPYRHEELAAALHKALHEQP